MQEYTINVREDGTAVIARDKWNPDHSREAMDNKPFLFEVGQKVVDIFSNVVTIKEILKHKPSKPGCCPEWNLLVEENGNCYRYTEIAGIYVREVSAVELLTLTKEDSSGLDKDLDVFETKLGSALRASGHLFPTTDREMEHFLEQTDSVTLPEIYQTPDFIFEEDIT